MITGAFKSLRDAYEPPPISSLAHDLSRLFLYSLFLHSVSPYFAIGRFQVSRPMCERLSCSRVTIMPRIRFPLKLPSYPARRKSMIPLIWYDKCIRHFKTQQRQRLIPRRSCRMRSIDLHSANNSTTCISGGEVQGRSYTLQRINSIGDARFTKFRYRSVDESLSV